MDWELSEVTMDIPYIIVAYIILFIIATVGVKNKNKK
tara:strand:- start:349 stop:459 length:111 start_codon:yes stop_codon:yes gene_type:complete